PGWLLTDYVVFLGGRLTGWGAQHDDLARFLACRLGAGTVINGRFIGQKTAGLLGALSIKNVIQALVD
ncbi:MAG: hypothetical protein PHT80_02335, partial [Lentisphaeria bacterium]|nr:hypothetical protein [Lentisphaeria bacterium]